MQPRACLLVSTKQPFCPKQFSPTDASLNAGANPTTAIYNASAVNICNASAVKICNASAVNICNASAVNICNAGDVKIYNASAVNICNASDVKIYNATISLVRFETK
jgi:hypothetical protein